MDSSLVQYVQNLRGDVFEFHVGGRYRDLSYIGQGAYGVVVAATDRHTMTRVAVKKISPFTHQTFSQRTLREVRLLIRFKHENIIELLDLLTADTVQDMRDIYMVQTLMDTDLHTLLKSQTLSSDHICYFMAQILRGLKFIHSANVLHRDLKPSNLLLNLNCDLKICDFGLARVADPTLDHAGMLTEYVATRWYRAPEIMLNSKAYTQAIDMWAVGCIFTEMMTRKPMFPGADYYQQLNLIFRVIGTPRPDELGFIRTEAARKYVARMPFSPRASFVQMLPDASPAAVDLLERIMRFNPDERITADEALNHEFLLGYHDEAAEPICTEPLGLDFEQDDLPIPTIQALLYEECMLFKHPSEVPQDAAATLAATDSHHAPDPTFQSQTFTSEL